MYTDFTIVNDASSVKTKTAADSKVSKGLKKLFIIAAVIFVLELIWLFGVSPFVPFSTIEVHSFDTFERGEVLRLAGIDDTSSFFSVNIADIHDKIAANILVESVIVNKRYPDKLSIFITPRQPAAVTLTSGQAQSLLYIDRQGVIYKEEAGINENLKYPVISGIEDPRVTMRFPDSLVPLTASLFEIAQVSPELLEAISEIRIEPKAWEGFELVLFPVHSAIRVRVENNLTEDTLRYILLMLNVFEASPDKSAIPDEIDFRSSIGSYRIRELS